MKTIWNKTVKGFNQLNSDISCDTLIIGGGIAGLWCAYKLTKAGQKVCVVEANKIGSGVTAGSSAILTFAQELLYDSLIKKHGEDVARKYLTDTQNAIADIKKIVKEEGFKINLSDTNFVLCSRKFGKLKKEKAALEKLGAQPMEIEEDELPYKIKSALLIKGSCLIDPLMLVSELTSYVVKNGGKIFENTMVTTQPTKNHIEINGCKVTAKHFIVATHYPYINFPGFYFLKLFQSQNYTIAFKPAKAQENFAKNTTFECIDNNGFEFRRVGNNVTCLGPDIRTGTKPYKSKYQIVEQHLEKYFKGYTEVARFSAEDCITADLLPYAGLYSNFLDNTYVVTGFNKWGMTNSYLTSEVVCNMILKKAAAGEDNIYAPDRNNFFASIIQTVENVGVDIAGWTNNLLNLDSKKISRIKNEQGAVVKLNGKRLGVYRDKNGKLSAIKATCPHLGCTLKWNKDETSFDCPCHGSRFDPSGNILNNPAIKPAEKVDVGTKK